MERRTFIKSMLAVGVMPIVGIASVPKLAPNERPWVEAEARASRLANQILYKAEMGYDASPNPVQAIHDYLSNPVYGEGLSSLEIDSSSFESMAHVCEAQIQEGAPHMLPVSKDAYRNVKQVSNDSVFDLKNSKVLWRT